MTRYLSVRIGGKSSPDAPVLTPARLADWCRRFTPLAAPDAPDGAMLDITGAAHLFGGENALAAEIEARLAKLGYEARAALADTPEAAWALARHGDARAIPEGADEKALRRHLGALPVAALRLDAQTAYALSQTGLKRIDDLILRPRAPIAARFGAEVFARLDGLLGRIRSPITPRFEAPVYLVERRFADPIARREDVEGALAMLAGDLTRLLERHGEGARQLEATLFRADGAVRRIAAASSRPLRGAGAIARLFHERIKAAGEARDEDPLDSGYGFDLLRLAALEVERLGARQDALGSVDFAPPTAPRSRRAATHEPAPEMAEDLTDLVDRLGARLGLRRVMRLIPQDAHLPEFAVLAMPAAQLRSGGREASWSGEVALPRPIRMFERPEPVEAMAEAPDGPPLRFRWRRVLHEVAAIEGPERISSEWWRQDAHALTRDYFRVEDRKGHRFWMYREGLYGVEAPRPRWFMQGLFA
jgi:protein ImuB